MTMCPTSSHEASTAPRTSAATAAAAASRSGSNPARARRLLAAGLAAVAAISLVHELRPFSDVGERFIGHADQAIMANQARNLAEGRGAVVDSAWLLHDGGVPGLGLPRPDEYYSLYVAAIVSLFFKGLGATREAVLLAAWLLKTASALLMGWWTLRLSKSRLAAFTCASFLMVHPAITSVSQELAGMFDVYMTFFTLASGSALLLAIERRSTPWFLAAGLLGGVALGIKASGAAIVGCALAYFALWPGRIRNLPRGLAYAAGLVAALTPLVVFNLQAFGSPLQPGLSLAGSAGLTREQLRNLPSSHSRAFYDPSPVERSTEQTASLRIARAASTLKVLLIQLRDGAVVPVILFPAIWFAACAFLARWRREPRAYAQLEGLFVAWGVLMACAGLALGTGIHFEPRYWNFLVPLACVLACAGMARLSPHLLVGLLLWAATFVAFHPGRFRPVPVPARYAEAAAALPAGAVVLTDNPWEFAFHTRLPSVMLPYTADPEQIGRLAQRFGAVHLALIDEPRIHHARHPLFHAIQAGHLPDFVEPVHRSSGLFVGRLAPGLLNDPLDLADESDGTAEPVRSRGSRTL